MRKININFNNIFIIYISLPFLRIINNMTNVKNINKTILFVSLIAAMIIPLSIMEIASAATQNTEEIYDGAKVKEAFIQLDPYMSLDDEKKIIFDSNTAKDNGLNKKTIKMGKEYAKLHNDMIDSLKDGISDIMKLDEKESKKFTKFFKKIKKGDDSLFTQSVIPATYAASCNIWGPHDQPDAVPKVVTFTPITTYLIFRGYHQV